MCALAARARSKQEVEKAEGRLSPHPAPPRAKGNATVAAAAISIAPATQGDQSIGDIARAIPFMYVSTNWSQEEEAGPVGIYLTRVDLV